MIVLFRLNVRVINNKELTEELKKTLGENKSKLENKKKPLRIGKILPMFNTLEKGDQTIIKGCKKNVTLVLKKKSE